MSPLSLPRRLTALATVSALALITVSPGWSAPPPIPPRVDPPARVGRVARLTGTVSSHTADADQWSPAALNDPFTNGEAFWTEPGARVDLQLASNRVTLAPTTELDIVTLDDQALATSEPQGETYLELRTVPAGNTYTIQTPRGAVQIAAAGRYDIVAGDTDHPTLITVVEGAAQVTGNNLSLQIAPRQTASITGTDVIQGSVGPIAQDAFLTAMLAEDRPAPRASAPIPQIVQYMTGSEDLQTAGSWAETPQYGTVWYPPVEAGWVPYRHGHWSYVAPWGWTWVDDAAWGFTPFHYGRWAEIDNRWGWIPVSPGAYADPVAAYPVPVYAPALVSFVDFGGAAVAGAAVGLAAGALAGRSVGWVPLGPHEAYYPPYRSNLNYVRSVNATVVQNVGQTINTTTINNNRSLVQNFTNRGAATVVPAAAMVQSQPVAAAARPLPADQFARTQAQFRAPLAPATTTAGVTPAVAREFNFVAPGRPTQASPGPSINPALFRAGVGRPGSAPSLRPAGAPSLRPGRGGLARAGRPAYRAWSTRQHAGPRDTDGGTGRIAVRHAASSRSAASPSTSGARACRCARGAEPGTRCAATGRSPRVSRPTANRVPTASCARAADGCAPGDPGFPTAGPGLPPPSCPSSPATPSGRSPATACCATAAAGGRTEPARGTTAPLASRSPKWTLSRGRRRCFGRTFPPPG